MFTTVRSKMGLSTGLVFLILVALFALGTYSVAKTSHLQYIGMGDLRRVESQGPVLFVGIGELRRFEALKFTPGNETFKSNHLSVGMGDLHRLEALQFSPAAWVLEKGNSYPGMGDLHRFEALQ